MAETVGITPQQLQTLLEAVLSKAQALNPLEQKKFDEDLAKERRRDAVARQVAEAEERASKARRDNCSHLRYPATAGKNSGQMAPKGTAGAEWCTGGQAMQNGLAVMFCSRCHSEWWFEPTKEYYNHIMQNGLDGIAPPPKRETICIGCFRKKDSCKCVEIAKEYAAAHPTLA